MVNAIQGNKYEFNLEEAEKAFLIDDIARERGHQQKDAYERKPAQWGISRKAALGALAAVSTAAVVSSLVKGAAACLLYCYRSISQDELKVNLAIVACARALPPAMAAGCGAALRAGIEYDKNVCASIGCGPFMCP